MKSVTSFSYNHATAGPIQHKDIDVLELELVDDHLHIVFDDQGGNRQITIDTNAVYVLRTEVVEDTPPPAEIGDTGRPA